MLAKLQAYLAYVILLRTFKEVTTKQIKDLCSEYQKAKLFPFTNIILTVEQISAENFEEENGFNKNDVNAYLSYLQALALLHKPVSSDVQKIYDTYVASGHFAPAKVKIGRDLSDILIINTFLNNPNKYYIITDGGTPITDR